VYGLYGLCGGYWRGIRKERRGNIYGFLFRKFLN